MKQADLVLLQNRIIAKALDVFAEPPVPEPFANDKEADDLVKDIYGYPHAFVIACLMARQIKAERALWPYPSTRFLA